MTYACEDYGFLFYWAGEIKECPACVKNYIRFATEEEAGRLKNFLEPEKSILLKEEQPYEKKD